MTNIHNGRLERKSTNTLNAREEEIIGNIQQNGNNRPRSNAIYTRKPKELHSTLHPNENKND